MIPTISLIFTCRWLTEAKIPDFPGPSFCAGLAHGLKKTLCTLKRQACEECILESSCGYVALFDSSSAEGASFVLDFPGQSNGTGEAGLEWCFSILFFKKAFPFLPHIVHSIQLLGEQGFGIGARDGMGQFVLKSILSGKACIYEEEKGIFDGSGLRVDKLCMNSPDSDLVSSLQLHLESPFRPGIPRMVTQVLPFYGLVEEALFRLRSLGMNFDQDVFPLSPADLVRKGKKVRIVQSDLYWKAKPERAHGLLGSANYTGNLNPFLPLLNLAGRVYLGRDTCLGMGKITLEYS